MSASASDPDPFRTSDHERPPGVVRLLHVISAATSSAIGFAFGFVCSVPLAMGAGLVVGRYLGVTDERTLLWLGGGLAGLGGVGGGWVALVGHRHAVARRERLFLAGLETDAQVRAVGGATSAAVPSIHGDTTDHHGQ